MLYIRVFRIFFFSFFELNATVRGVFSFLHSYVFIFAHMANIAFFFSFHLYLICYALQRHFLSFYLNSYIVHVPSIYFIVLFQQNSSSLTIVRAIDGIYSMFQLCCSFFYLLVGSLVNKFHIFFSSGLTTLTIPIFTNSIQTGGKKMSYNSVFINNSFALFRFLTSFCEYQIQKFT